MGLEGRIGEGDAGRRRRKMKAEMKVGNVKREPFYPPASVHTLTPVESEKQRQGGR